MSVHSSGVGTGWNESLDVDQPHGKDYIEFNDLRIGIRKRISQEHVTIAGATAGGVHKPGGVAVLGMEITDAAGDPTGAAVGDGTYRARGLVWSYVVEAGANKGVLFCSTAAAGASTADDFTVLKMHPDLQWGGGDVTWAGAHEFDATVCFDGEVEFAAAVDFSTDVTVTIGGDLTVGGEAHFDGTVNFNSTVEFSADVTVFIGGDISVGGVAAFQSDVSIDGTVAFQDAVLTGDSTFTFDAIAGETGPTIKMFGDWSSRSQDTTYTARTDGFAVGYGIALNIKGQTPAGTERIVDGLRQGTKKGSITMPVRGGDTWAIVADPTTTAISVLWLPIGDNT